MQVLVNNPEFGGYDENFVLLSNPRRISSPLKDTIAKLFLDPAFIAPAALLDGKTTDEV